MDIDLFIKQIEQFQKEQDSIYHNFAVKHGLSDTALWILYIISDKDNVYTQQELCRLCYYPKQTVNTSITKLVKLNYVALEVIPKTRNQKRVVLTEKGAELANCVVKPLVEAEKRAYSNLTEHELETYLELTARLTLSLHKEIEKI